MQSVTRRVHKSTVAVAVAEDHSDDFIYWKALAHTLQNCTRNRVYLQRPPMNVFCKRAPLKCWRAFNNFVEITINTVQTRLSKLVWRMREEGAFNNTVVERFQCAEYTKDRLDRGRERALNKLWTSFDRERQNKLGTTSLEPTTSLEHHRNATWMRKKCERNRNESKIQSNKPSSLSKSTTSPNRRARRPIITVHHCRARTKQRWNMNRTARSHTPLFIDAYAYACMLDKSEVYLRLGLCGVLLYNINTRRKLKTLLFVCLLLLQ